MTFISQLQHVLNTPSFTHDFNKTKNMNRMQDKSQHKDGSKSYENVVQFQHLQIMSTNENCMPEGITNTEFKECMLLLCLSSPLLLRNIKTKIHKTTILPVVLYGQETSSLTFRKEYRMRTMENRVLRKVCEYNREGVIRKWTKTHNERLHGNLYF
jgi:hypothetical protein